MGRVVVVLVLQWCAVRSSHCPGDWDADKAIGWRREKTMCSLVFIASKFHYKDIVSRRWRRSRAANSNLKQWSRAVEEKEGAYHGKRYYLLNGHNFVTERRRPKMKRKKFYWKNRKMTANRAFVAWACAWPVCVGADFGGWVYRLVFCWSFAG